MSEPSTAPRIALVTGAGTGIGRASALALAAAGFAVVLAGRHAETLDAVAAAIEAAGGTALAVATDVADSTAVERLFTAIEARFGRIDFVFNNAGRGSGSIPIDELGDADWQAVVGVNLTGVFNVTRAAFRLMKRQVPQGGRIVNNGSISAHAPRPNTLPYTTTKHAITGLTKSVALDGRPFDIACGQIDIGNAATDMTERMAAGIAQADGSIRAEPRMDVEDVARAVVHMASLPPGSNILFMTVMATKMPFVGRG